MAGIAGDHPARFHLHLQELRGPLQQRGHRLNQVFGKGIAEPADFSHEADKFGAGPSQAKDGPDDRVDASPSSTGSLERAVDLVA